MKDCSKFALKSHVSFYRTALGSHYRPGSNYLPLKLSANVTLFLTFAERFNAK